MINQKIQGASGVKYTNIYVCKGAYSELHICAGVSTDYVFLIDSNLIHLLKYKFWRCTFVGKEGYKKPQVYCTGSNGDKLYLSRFILGKKDIKKVYFRNRNPYDYRITNLCIADNSVLENRDRNRYSELGMNNIRPLVRNGRLVAYQVTFKEDGRHLAKSFNIEKLGGADIALNAAKRFRDSLLEAVG